MIFALAVAAAAVAAPTPDVGLKTYTLGSSIETFKSQTLEDGEYGLRKVVCSDMPDALTWLTPAFEGAVDCSFEQSISGTRTRSDLDLTATVSATVDFQFIGGKLAIIESYLDSTRSGVVGESLATRFGKPATVEEKPFQVRSGATFPQVVTTWKIGTKTVTTKAPDLNINRMSVTYVDTPVVSKALATRKPANIM